MKITEIDLSGQIATAQLAFALLLIGFSLAVIAFGKLGQPLRSRADLSSVK